MKKGSSGVGATLMKTKSSIAGAMFMNKSSGDGAVSFLRRFRSPGICDMKIMAVRNYNGHFLKTTREVHKNSGIN